MTFEDIERNGVESFLHQIHNELKSETYYPLRNRLKEIPKASGKVDEMLERAKEATKIVIQGKSYTNLEYYRWADDIVILVDSYQKWEWLFKAAYKRLREELSKIGVTLNTDKTRLVYAEKGNTFSFLGFRFKRIRTRQGKEGVLRLPKIESRTKLLRKLKEVFRQHRSHHADPFTASLHSAFAFCSTYVLRPFGALLFGYIGDNIGRITAAWVVTICRMVQGLSAMGEVTGANIYITEITKPPIQYPAVTITSICSALGGVFALAVATFVTSFNFNWRIAFWIGALVAIVGAVARTRLRETPDFADAKRRVKKALAQIKRDPKILKENVIWVEKNAHGRYAFTWRICIAEIFLKIYFTLPQNK
eukprot:jgi/Mesvir1/25263/Mv20330-RA.1